MPDILNTARAKFTEAREKAFGDITNSFTRVGTAFENPSSILYVQNLTDQIMDFSISFEGEDVTFSLLPNGTLCADMEANQVAVAKGEGIFVKYRSTPPTSGFVQYSSVLAV